MSNSSSKLIAQTYDDANVMSSIVGIHYVYQLNLIMLKDTIIDAKVRFFSSFMVARTRLNYNI